MWFSLSPVSFSLLSDEEADQEESRFVLLLNTVENGIILARSEPFSFEGKQFMRRRFFLFSKEEPPSVFSVAACEAPKRPGVKKEAPDYLVLENGRFARCSLFVKFPDYLLEGFLHEYSLACDETVILFRALETSHAASIVDKLRRTYEGLSTDRRATSSVLQKAKKLQELAFSVGSTNKLFEIFVYLIYSAPTLEALDELEKQIKKHARGRLCDLQTPRFFQGALYSFKTGFFGASLRPRYTPGSSLRAFFPLIEENVFDEDGVLLGYSTTNAPVFFNPFARNNYNVVILGETGSGKSLTAKMLVSGLRKKGIRVLGLDPEDEYVRVADVLGTEAKRITREESLGLDPFKMMREGLLALDEVADILSEFYLVKNEEFVPLSNQLRLAIADLKPQDVESFVKQLNIYSKKLYEYISPAIAEPDVRIFSGNPPTVGGNYVFGVKELSGAVGGSRYKILASTLLTVYLQKELFGNYERGLFFVDEAWQFLNFPVTMQVFEAIARKARKYNKAFVFITQKPADVASNQSGRTILEQSSTSILFRQRQAAIPILKEIYRLREEEARALIEADTGEGVMRSGNFLLKLRVTPTEEQLRVFSTTGEWMRT